MQSIFRCEVNDSIRYNAGLKWLPEARQRLIIIEITQDAVLPALHELTKTNALLLPSVLDILPPFTYESLGMVSRMVLQPSAAVRSSMRALTEQLSAASCTRTIAIHFRGGFVRGDFKLHENVHAAALARVIQTARQIADDDDDDDADAPASKACFIIAGDNTGIRLFARDALSSWGFLALDVSAAQHVIANVGIERDAAAARAALQEWFMLSAADVIILQQHSSFGLSAGIHGGCKGFTVAEHRVINGFSCWPWCATSVAKCILVTFCPGTATAFARWM
jgi:hypothetical protein